MDLDDASAALRAVADRHPGLRLVLVLGSRARGTAHAGSDWDIGYLGDVDTAGLVTDIAAVLQTDDVDVVDLARASALLRFEAGRDGHVVYEREPGTHLDFTLEATLFWCDAEAVIRRAGAAVLSGLTNP